MSFLDSIKTGKQATPRRTMIYGPGGIGKSTWASQFPNPIFIDIEGGVDDIDVPKIECDDLVSVYNALQGLVTEEHSFETVVIDSADWFERLIWNQLCDESSHADIAEFGFGQGYSKAVGRLDEFVKVFDILRKNGIAVVIVAHSDIKKFSNPNGESYDRYQPKMHHSFASRLIEWCDEVFFCNYKVFTREIKDGVKKRSVGASNGERVMYSTETPGHIAKSRLPIPAEVPLAYSEYSKYVSGRPKPKGVAQ